jgi:GNAT superfamily N-acetyltransferase
VTLRVFDQADIDAVSALIHRTIYACYPAAYPPLAVAFFKQFHSPDAICDRASAGLVVVAEGDSGIVATGARAGCEISGVFVTPESQGQGLGAQVMDELEATALLEGHRTVRLSVSLPSRGFYERRGYVVVKDCSIDVGEGQRLLYWEAEKSLRA